MLTDLVTRYGPVPVLLATTLVGWSIGAALRLILRLTSERRGSRLGRALAESLAGLPLLWGALVGFGVLLPTLNLTLRTQRITVNILQVLWIASFTWLGMRLSGRLVRAWTTREGDGQSAAS